MTRGARQRGPSRVTISLVTYNGAAWLPGCLASIDAQEEAAIKVVVMDNASDDGSLELVQAWADQRADAVVRTSRSNLGYAVAHNAALAHASGDFVLLLNQDVELDPGFLRSAVAAFDARPHVGAVQGRLRQLSGPGRRLATIDTTGLQMGRDRRAISRGQDQLDGPAQRVAGPIWGADGPAPVYRLEALRSVRLPRRGGGYEILDEDFFLYKEDVDLAWRLRALGWEAWYEPAALAWHARGTGRTGASGLIDVARANRTIAPGAAALSWRNQRLMQVKNEELGGYLRDLPWIAKRELLSALYMLVLDRGRFRAVGSLLRALPQAMRKRMAHQRLVARARSGGS